MNKNLQKAGQPVDVSIPKRKPSYDAPPATANNGSTAPAAQVRSAFIRLFHAFGQDKNR